MTDEMSMTNEQFSRELEYQLALHFVKQLRQMGLIADADNQKWRNLLIRECNPPVGKLDNPALSPSNDEIA